MRYFARVLPFVCCVTIARPGHAQAPSPIRPIGRLLAVSTEPLLSVSQIRALPGGKVIVHDNTSRRVLMFDSTLQHATVIADPTGASGNLYNSRLGGLIAYRGDSTLFVDPTTFSMLVIAPTGHVVRTIAVPPASASGNYLVGGPYGTPGLDARGRLVYRVPISHPPPPGEGMSMGPDSALIVRFDFGSRAFDTVVKVGILVSRFMIGTVVSNGREMASINFVVDPIPWTDDWAVLSDGTIAVVRGRNYRVDYIDSDKWMASTAKLPFAWQRLSDENKIAIIDSTRSALDSMRKATRDSMAKARPDLHLPTTSLSNSVPWLFPALNEMPDYRPPFREGAVRSDADGNLWVRTSTISDGGAVYDVVNRQGVLIDHVQVPPGRVIAGFGPGGMVYMGVLDGGVAKVERALVH